jgi:hypothetical protein
LPDSTIAPVTVLAALVGELTCAWAAADTPSHAAAPRMSIRFIALSCLAEAPMRS